MITQFKNNAGLKIQKVSSIALIDNYSSPSNNFVIPKEVWDIVKPFISAKVPDYDHITNMALKHLSKAPFTFLTNIFTSYFRHSYFPTEWIKALIIIILKPRKNHQIPENFRPIFLYKL